MALFNNSQQEDVAKQNHYEALGIQPIDYMRANMTKVEFNAVLQANVLKYISRYKRKDGIKDIRKAQVYLAWLEESLEE